MNKAYSLLGTLILLTSCSVEELCPEGVTLVSPPPPSYPVTTSPAIIIKKHVLPHKRMDKR